MLNTDAIIKFIYLSNNKMALDYDYNINIYKF